LTPHWLKFARTAVRTIILCSAIIPFANSQALATPIDEKYAELGGMTGFLGATSEAETTAPDRTGRFRHYTGGSIYWHPTTGAHVVYGLIRRKWDELGGPQSYLGYPMSDNRRSQSRRLGAARNTPRANSAAGQFIRNAAELRLCERSDNPACRTDRNCWKNHPAT
jgi:uncharacterized protein with LGFP repeats